jgi:hypothetical protein
MGWKKFFKKVTRAVKKPVSKVFKGVAKGIAKVGKSVMKGIAKVNKKFGPLGMIAMSIALPMAMQGLSGMVGYGANTPFASGLLARPEGTFLRAVGNIGSQIRTGYRVGTGAIGKGIGKVGEVVGRIGTTITDSITKTFQKFGGNKTGDNFWTRISKGAKNLFNSAKEVVTGQKKTGYVDVGGVRQHHAVDGIMKTHMKSADAAKYIGQEGITFSGQSTGFASSASDKLITETINKAAQNQVNMLDKAATRHYNDLLGTGRFTNNQEALDAVLENVGTKFQPTTGGANSYVGNLAQNPDYKFNPASTRPNPHTISGSSIQDANYTFTGGETFNTPVGNHLGYKKTINKAKKVAYNFAKTALLAPKKDVIEYPDYAEFVPTAGATSNDGYIPGLSSTDIKGAFGNKELLIKVFGTERANAINNQSKHMNYQGDIHPR